MMPEIIKKCCGWVCRKINIVAYLTGENLALRQQLLALKRNQNRPKLKERDRLFWRADYFGPISRVITRTEPTWALKRKRRWNALSHVERLHPLDWLSCPVWAVFPANNRKCVILARRHAAPITKTLTNIACGRSIWLARSSR